jgi:hypothetical protein
VSLLGLMYALPWHIPRAARRESKQYKKEAIYLHYSSMPLEAHISDTPN